MTKRDWVQSKLYPAYEVSQDGAVRNRKHKNIMNEQGSLVVEYQLTRNGIRHMVPLKRLMEERGDILAAELGRLEVYASSLMEETEREFGVLSVYREATGDEFGSVRTTYIKEGKNE